MKNFGRSLMSIVIVCIFVASAILLVGCAGQLSVTDTPTNTPTYTTYTLSLSTSNSDYGLVYGAGTYAEGEEISICALANEGYEFDKWNDNNTQNPRKVKMNEAKSFTASFKEKTKFAYIESVKISLASSYSGWEDASLVTTNNWRVTINGYRYGGSGKREVLLEEDTNTPVCYYILNGCRTSFSSYNGEGYVNNKLEINKNVSTSISFGLALNIDGSAKDYTELSATSIIFNATDNQLKVLYDYLGYGKIEVTFIYNVK